MAYALAENLSFCVAGGQTVLLDVAKGRFLSPAARTGRALQRWIQGQPAEDGDNRQLNALLESGVLIRAAGERRRHSNPASAVSSIRSELQVSGTNSSHFGMLHAMAIQLLWDWRTKHWSLSQIVDAMRAARLRVKEFVSDAERTGIVRIVENFARADLVLGCHDRCLARSIALGVAMRTRLIPVDVIIGVQTDPFIAHCWVQLDGTVINDNRERVRPFTPILVM